MDLTEIFDFIITQSKSKGIEQVELVANSAESKSIDYRLQKTEHLEVAFETVLGIRAIKGKKQAVISTTNLSKQAISNLVTQIDNMVNNAESDEYLQLAEVDNYFQGRANDYQLHDGGHDVSDQDVLNMLSDMETAANSVEGVTNTDVAKFFSSRNQVYLLNSNGFNHNYTSTDYYLYICSLAGRDQNMERDYDYSCVRHYSDLKNPKELGKQAGKNAVAKLGAKTIKSNKMPVIFKNRVAGGVLAKFAELINGSSIVNSMSVLKDKLGHKLFPEVVNIYDDPTLVRGLGSRYFDGEFMSCHKLPIVREGVLENFLLDLRSANYLKLACNNRSSRNAGSVYPNPAVSNLYVEKGSASLEEMLADVSYGILVTETFGMGVNNVTGTYSQGASGFLIENGEIKHAVNNITVASNLLDMFRSIELANDLEFNNVISSPSIMFSEMSVAGN